MEQYLSLLISQMFNKCTFQSAMQGFTMLIEFTPSFFTPRGPSCNARHQSMKISYAPFCNRFDEDVTVLLRQKNWK